MYSTRWWFAVEAYKDSTRELYSYLLVDLYVPEKWKSAWNAIYLPWEEYT